MLPGCSRLRELGRLPRGVGEPLVPPPTSSAPRNQDPRTVLLEIRNNVGRLRVVDNRADRHGKRERLRRSPPALVDTAGDAVWRRAAPIVEVRVQGGHAPRGLEDHVATTPAITTVRPAAGHELFAVKRNGTVPTTASGDLDLDVVDHDLWMWIRYPRWSVK